MYLVSTVGDSTFGTSADTFKTFVSILSNVTSSVEVAVVDVAGVLTNVATLSITSLVISLPSSSLMIFSCTCSRSVAS